MSNVKGLIDEQGYTNQVAKLSWDGDLGRYELRILNKLKAFTEGETAADHNAGKRELIQLAKEKGYAVMLVGGA